MRNKILIVRPEFTIIRNKVIADLYFLSIYSRDFCESKSLPERGDLLHQLLISENDPQSTSLMSYIFSSYLTLYVNAVQMHFYDRNLKREREYLFPQILAVRPRKPLNKHPKTPPYDHRLNACNHIKSTKTKIS